MIGLLVGVLGSGSVLGATNGVWELAAIYDASAIKAAGIVEQAADGGIPEAPWLWQPAAGMTTHCGLAKSPDGLGVMEGEVIANRLSPALAVVLRHTGPDAPILDTHNLRLSIGRNRGEVQLSPMVEPTPLVIRLDGDGAEADKQLVRTQLAMELCMEHKTGRAWPGAGRAALREAFLLRDPGEEGAQNMYFRGQGAPVPALRGPTDACFAVGSAPPSNEPPLAGPTRLSLVPADVWGASLRTCDDKVEARDLPLLHPPPRVPLQLGGAEPPAPEAHPTWQDLEVTVSRRPAGGSNVTLRFNGTELATAEQLVRTLEPDADGEVQQGVYDLLAHVPSRFPKLGPAADPGRYTLLLVPNWQIVEVAEGLGLELPRGPGLEVDGVGWILDHPAHLFVQVVDREDTNLENLASRFGGVGGSLLRWGYPTGLYAGRSEIILPGTTPPTWKQTSMAQRAPAQALFLGALTVLLTLGISSLGRLRDLWTRVPEERIHYWPGAREPAAPGPAPANPIAGATDS